MNNYIITEKTVALRKLDKKTIIYDVDKIRVINKNIKTILNNNCNFYGSTLNGRIKSSQNILNIKYRVPIVINESITLLPLNSIRNNNTLLIVASKVIDYEEHSNLLKINCNNKQIFYTKLSKYSFEKLLLNNLKLNNTIKARNLTNFV